MNILYLTALWLGLAAIPAQAVDLAKGQALYEECKGCHALRENLMGPRHCWVVGRPSGKVPDFTYSDVMKQSNLIWDAKTLDQFLATPFSFLSGTSMGYAGIYDKKDRDDLIAYLTKLSTDPQACEGIDKLR